MRSASIVAGGLLVAGSGVLLVQTVRSAVLWIVEPGSEYVAPAGAALLAVGIAVLVMRRARPLVGAVSLAVAGIASAVLARLVAALATTTVGGADIAYGPGTPPSFSGMLLASQVLEPALMVLAVVLIAAGAVRIASLLVVARATGRIAPLQRGR